MMRNLKRVVSLLAVLLISCAVSGCETMMKNNPAAADFCATAKPIFVSRSDEISDATAREILTHNLTGQKLCGWKGK